MWFKVLLVLVQKCVAFYNECLCIYVIGLVLNIKNLKILFRDAHGYGTGLLFSPLGMCLEESSNFEKLK